MSQMSSICFEDVFCPQEYSSFNDDGNSHDYPLHRKSWFRKEPYQDIAYYDFGDKKSICLIDSGIENDVDKKLPNTIRMCIDKNARSIIFQTCREKAEHGTLNITETDFDWEKREKYTMLYHYADRNSDFYLNDWKPAAGCTNIAISDLFFNPVKMLKQLKPHFGACNMGKFWTLWNDFISANKKYYKAQILVNRVSAALEGDYDCNIAQDYSLHDQGYLIYWLEKCYNIQEIPPYDYRHWFKNTQEIRDCLNSIRSQ